MHYAIDLPDFGAYGDPRLLASLAGTAEDHGWDGFFIRDHIIAPHAMPVADTTVALTVDLTVEQIREVRASIAKNRSSAAPFDIIQFGITAGRSREEAAHKVAAFVER